jgi:hypothetical protein
VAEHQPLKVKSFRHVILESFGFLAEKRLDVW